MAYFANSTDAADYQDKYCFKCVHGGDDPKSDCAVMFLHFCFADHDKESANTKKILDELIPMDGVRPMKCSMFISYRSLLRLKGE